jgi:KDO2-lipid IV(A) lauroyltransferase
MSEPSARTTAAPVPLRRFWQPRYWLLWVGVILLRIGVLLPYRLQLLLGRGLGGLFSLALGRRRRIAAANLALCFPTESEAWRARVLRRHFQSLGIAVFELGLAWWASDRRLRRLVRLRGTEHLRAALDQGRGVILLSAHFAATELTGRVLHLEFPSIAALYRPNRNPFVDELLRRGRNRSVDWLIPKDSMRQMIRALRQGLPVWYAPDQSHRRRYSALLPFFGEPAMTNTALTQIIRLSGARVVPYLPRRREDGSGYDVDILPALEDFPGESPEADALRVNRLFEDHIRGAPDQYYWVHRRFKGRPGMPDPY